MVKWSNLLKNYQGMADDVHTESSVEIIILFQKQAKSPKVSARCIMMFQHMRAAMYTRFVHHIIYKLLRKIINRWRALAKLKKHDIVHTEGAGL